MRESVSGDRHRTERRRGGRAVAGVTLTLALGLAACGSPDAAAGDSPSGDGEYPLTVDTSQGKVTIPKEPHRIVATSATTADELLSLGVKPFKVAVTPEELKIGYPWLVEDATAIADGGLMQKNYELNVEAIAAARPDLIIAQTFQVTDKAVFEQLNSVAPTITPDSKALNVDWDERLLKTAEAVGETKKAETLIAKVEKEFAAVGDTVPGISSKTYQWVRADPDGFGFGNGSVLELFGLKPAANQDNTQNTNPSLSKEKTAELDADLLAVWAPTKELRKQLDNDPLFQALPSVKNGTVIYADLDFADAANSPAPMALRWLKDKIVPYIEALANRPVTD